jgi:hypothetical protein
VEFRLAEVVAGAVTVNLGGGLLVLLPSTVAYSHSQLGADKQRSVPSRPPEIERQEMTKQTNISERERRRSAWQRAMSVQAFCERYDIGRTKAYEEINAGRLKARKAGRRTIITADDAEDWLSRLPALQEALDEAGS